MAQKKTDVVWKKISDRSILVILKEHQLLIWLISRDLDNHLIRFLKTIELNLAIAFSLFPKVGWLKLKRIK